MTFRSRLAGLKACCLHRLTSPTRIPSPVFSTEPCRIAALIATAVAMTATITLPATAVHRCESGGKVSYSDLPCAGASTLNIDHAPPSMHAATTVDIHQQRQSAELARLQQLRELRERQDQRIRDLAARGAAAREKKCRTLAMQLKWRDEDLREASLKQEANARKRLRRTEERYREECR